MWRRTATLLLAAALFWGGSSSAEPPRFPVDHNGMAIGATEKTPDDLKAMVSAGTRFVLVDVHPRIQFEKETIQGAVNIPLEDLDDGLMSIPKDRVLVFVCLHGFRSSQAAKIAEAAGFPNPTYGSILRWKDEGNEVVAGKEQASRL